MIFVCIPLAIRRLYVAATYRHMHRLRHEPTRAAPPSPARTHARHEALSGALLHVHRRRREVPVDAHHHHGRLVRADEGDHRPVGSSDLRAPRALVPCSCRGLRPPLPRGGVVGHLRPATRPPAPSVAVAGTEETTFFGTVLLWLYDEFARRVFEGWEPLLLTSRTWVVHAWYRTGDGPLEVGRRKRRFVRGSHVQDC